MITKRIYCTVYLEGLPVNFNSIQIQEREGMPPQATISFPADSAALTLLPKTVAHVFYQDNGVDVLIFMGELNGSGISFSSDKRSINLTFAGLTQNWHTNVVIPMDVKIRTMLSKGVHVQVTAEDAYPSRKQIDHSIPWDDIKSYIADKESKNDPTIISVPNTDGTRDSGLYQINDAHFLPVDKKTAAYDTLRKEIDLILFANYGMTAPYASVEQKRKWVTEGDRGKKTNEEIARAIYKHQGLNAWTTYPDAKQAYNTDPARNSSDVTRSITAVTTASGGQDGPISDRIKFFGMGPVTSLDTILNLLKDGDPASLTKALKLLVDTFSINFEGVYWAMLSKAFMFDQMYVIDNYLPGLTQIYQLFKNVTLLQHIKDQANSVAAGQNIHTLLMTILSAMGLDYCEISAPTYFKTGDLRGHVFVKPQLYTFPPVKHNVVFDDNVAYLNFSRNFDTEPTRMVTQTVPFQMQDNNNEFVNAVVSIVIPNNVRLASQPTDITTPEGYAQLKMFGLSQEEQCRGIIAVERQDRTNMENAYLMAIAKDNGVAKEDDASLTATTNQSPDNATSVTRNLSAVVGSKDKEKSKVLDATERYYTNIASVYYYNQRHAGRTLQVHSPYSPHRLVGFPGVVISKYFPKDMPGIVGNLAGITSHISADGDATQTLTFTHCRFVDDNEQGQPKYGFLDDDTRTPIPWYRDYTSQNNVNDFYKQYTGETSSAVIDVEATPENAVASAVKKLAKGYYDAAASTKDSTEAYVRRITKRNLVPRSVISKLFPLHPKKVRVLENSPKIEYKLEEIFPYVHERRERVTAAFDVTYKTLNKEIQ